MLKRSTDGMYRISLLEYGSPAHHSPLRVGDVVVSINGTALRGLEPSQADDLLKGRRGEKLAVAYLEDGKPALIVLTVAETPEEQVQGRLLPGGLIYVRLPDFRSHEIGADLVGMIFDLNHEAAGNAAGIILDLRANPGGYFNTAVDVVSLFLPGGIVATTTSRDGEGVKEEVHPAKPFFLGDIEELAPEELKLRFLLYAAPMVVLTDGSTASASELVSGALKDNRRARIVGTTTFGKSLGFRTYRLRGGGTLRVTTMHYLTPDGIDVARGGLAPDRIVPQSRTGRDVQLEAAVEEITKMIAGRGDRR